MAKKAAAKKTTTAKDKGGRPEKTLNEAQYKTLDGLCAIHATGPECAACLDMCYDTLNRILTDDGHGGFSEYFAQKSAMGNVSLRRMQFSKAQSGSERMQIHLGKQWLGQRDNPMATGLLDITDRILEVVEVEDPEPMEEENFDNDET